MLITTRPRTALDAALVAQAESLTQFDASDLEIIMADPQELSAWLEFDLRVERARIECTRDGPIWAGGGPMNLTSVFRFSLHLLVALAGGMLAFGEETVLPSGMTVLFSACAWYLHQRPARLRLPLLAGNLMGLAALAAAGYEFFGESADARLLAVAHFLAYITWIVLVQAKGVRQYWWLCALSLLQVAVGSVLTSSTGTYGLMLLAYLLLALWTLSVFTLYQGAFEFGGLNEAGGDAAAGPAFETHVRAAAPPSQPPSTAALVANFHAVFSSERSSMVRNAIQQDFPSRWIMPRFVVGVLGLSVAGLALGLAMFLLVPRIWVGGGGGGIRYQTESRHAQAVVGFSGEVRLGQIGQILESTERVMRVQIFDRDAENKVMAIEEFASDFGLSDPLFRGSVLERYQDGRWKSGRDYDQRTLDSPRKGDRGLIRQEYVLELANSEVLFAMRPITMARLDAPYGLMNYNPETGVFAGAIEGRDPIRYFVYSNRRNPDDPPPGKNEFGEMRGSRGLTPHATQRYLQKPAAGIDQLVELAGQVADAAMQTDRSIGDPNVSPERRKAVALSAYLSDEGRFAYSLNMAVEDPHSDPVEEFLFVRKQGHCEYFASALALMLRSVQIPARLVTGFKGADYHKNEGYYEVQQRHGHVWVEAWFDNQWIVLDATPEARDEAVRNVAGHAGFWKNARSSIQSLWSTYVVSLSLNRQQQTLYEPLQGSVSSGWGSMSNLLSRAASGVGWIKQALATPEQVLTPRGAALGLGVLVVAWMIFIVARRSRRRARRRAGPMRRQSWIRHAWAWLAKWLTGRAPDSAGMIVEFYEQFLSLASAAGFARREDQTPREFARQVEEALNDRLAAAGLSQFPVELAELFYRVRFGAGRLEPLEAGDIEQRLTRLAGALAPRDRDLKWGNLSRFSLIRSDAAGLALVVAP